MYLFAEPKETLKHGRAKTASLEKRTNEGQAGEEFATRVEKDESGRRTKAQSRTP